MQTEQMNKIEAIAPEEKIVLALLNKLALSNIKKVNIEFVSKATGLDEEDVYSCLCGFRLSGVLKSQFSITCPYCNKVLINKYPLLGDVPPKAECNHCHRKFVVKLKDLQVHFLLSDEFIASCIKKGWKRL